MISLEVRRKIATELLRIYPGGYGVVSPTLQRLFAVVDPRGAIRELPPPHHFVEMWELANQPATPECPCRNFYDPEVGGAWKLRDIPDHHPLCQFDRSSSKVFKEAATRPWKRPDDWVKLREQIRT